jgi:predicted RNA binding protein YcfA (HicA-like mRNA interferase family)
MPKLRRLWGSAVIQLLEGFSFIVHAQAGGHVKLRRIGPHGQK